MKWFRRNDIPERPISCTSEEYERLMKTLGRMDAQVESLELKWKAWKETADRVVARIERRDQRAAKRAEAENGPEEPATDSDIERRIQARRNRWAT